MIYIGQVASVDGEIQPTVYWRNERGQQLSESQLLRYIPTSSISLSYSGYHTLLTLTLHCRSSLTIRSLQLSHAGTYTCVAELPGASSSSSVELIVNINGYGSVSWLENPAVRRAQIGEDLTVDCAPATQQPVSTRWTTEDGRDLPSSAVQVGSRLEFRRLRLADAGVYVCIASNTLLGESRLFLNLVIVGPPGE